MMTGLEALKNMCENCERSKVGRKELCPFRSISNDYCEEYETIEKKLKRLDKQDKVINILKKCIHTNLIYRTMLEDRLECGWITQEEYELATEGLADD